MFEEYLQKIDEPDHREKMSLVLDWVAKSYPNLVGKIAWNQPMFTDHGTYIIGFSHFKNNFAVAPEQYTMNKFKQNIEKSGYTYTKNFVRIGWNEEVDYGLLKKFIDFNIQDKADMTLFWRKETE